MAFGHSWVITLLSHSFGKQCPMVNSFSLSSQITVNWVNESHSLIPTQKKVFLAFRLQQIFFKDFDNDIFSRNWHFAKSLGRKVAVVTVNNDGRGRKEEDKQKQGRISNVHLYFTATEKLTGYTCVNTGAFFSIIDNTKNKIPYHIIDWHSTSPFFHAL